MTNKKTDPDTPPYGEAALEPITQGGKVDRKLHIERAMEGFKKLMEDMGSDRDFAPIVIGRNGGDIVFTQLEEKDGKYVMPVFRAPSRRQLVQKTRMVDEIVRKMRRVLHRDIENVVKTALLRKRDAQIRDLKRRLEKTKSKPQLRNRIGCIFLEIDDESIQI